MASDKMAVLHMMDGVCSLTVWSYSRTVRYG